MSGSQVTITLGRSGLKVVKRPRAAGDGASAGSYSDNSWFPMNKRVRGDIRSSGYERLVEARVGLNDLRLKLMHKRITKRMQQEVEGWRKMESHESMSRTVRPAEGFFRREAPAKRVAGLMPMSSLRRSYSSRTLEGLIPKSPDGVVRVPRSFSPPPLRSMNEFRGLPSTRKIDASRTAQLLSRDILHPSRPGAPASIPLRTTLDAARPVSELPTASGCGLHSPHSVERTLTVSSLLNSLGLEKYAIHFRAEEVDMAVLKQMGDRDLKELGIPMGPRKKILLALLSSQSRQQQLKP